MDPLGPEILSIETAPGFTAATVRSYFLHDDGNLATCYIVITAEFKVVFSQEYHAGSIGDKLVRLLA